LDVQVLAHQVTDAQRAGGIEEADAIGEVEARRQVLADDEGRLLQRLAGLDARLLETERGAELLRQQVAAVQAEAGGGVGEQAAPRRSGWPPASVPWRGCSSTRIEPRSLVRSPSATRLTSSPRTMRMRAEIAIAVATTCGFSAPTKTTSGDGCTAPGPLLFW